MQPRHLRGVLAMDHSIHDCLDGERTRDELTARERDEIDALEAVISAVASPLRAVAAPDLSGLVMTRVANARHRPSLVERATGRVKRSLAWLWTPRPLHLRPAYGVAMLSVISLFAVVATPPGSVPAPHGSQAAAEAGPSPQIYVQFRLEARGASQVALAGSFTGWNPEHQLREVAPGTWSILLPLTPGVHDYAFVVDGRTWIADPHAFHIDDGFGGVNSRIALPAPPSGSTRS